MFFSYVHFLNTFLRLSEDYLDEDLTHFSEFDASVN